MKDEVALLSVRPEYVRLIREGVKRVEFRRRSFARRLTHIVIYESGAARRVAGVCAVEAVVQAVAAELWRRYGAVGGIDRESLLRYLDGAALGTEIVLGAFTPVVGGGGLSSLGVRRPPQSFQYLAGDCLEALGVR